MLHIKSVNFLSTSFPLNTSGSYKYHDYHDSESLVISDIWLWLIKRHNCSKVLFINGTQCSNAPPSIHLENSKIDLSVSPTSAPIEQSNHTVKGGESNSLLQQFYLIDFSIGASVIREDLNGNTWEITLESEDGKENGYPLSCRVYRIRLKSTGSKSAGYSPAVSIVDRFLSIFSLEALWDGDFLPPIAEFKKQIYCRVFNPTVSKRNYESENEILIVDQLRGNESYAPNDKDQHGVHSTCSLPPISISILLILLDANIGSKIGERGNRCRRNDRETVVDGCGSSTPSVDQFAYLRTAATIDQFAHLRTAATIDQFAYLRTAATIDQFAYLRTAATIDQFAYLRTAASADQFAYLRRAANALGYSISEAQILYLSRLAASVVRDLTDSKEDGRGSSSSQNHSLSERNNFNLFVTDTRGSNDDASLHDGDPDRRDTGASDVSDNDRVRVKTLPTSEKGISVLEFFSGIGGMRLALPDHIRGLPVRSINAYDCSETANDIYAANFDTTDGTGVGADEENDRNVIGPAFARGKLNRVLIDGLKLSDVDGKADVWTMSPPCQPYTTTKGAHQLDGKDNRSRPFLHLMSLLRQMESRPRWIVLENVKGFLHSDVLRYWKTVLHACGYIWKQFLLSPVYSVGLPNHRMRYYMVAEYFTREGQTSAFINSILFDGATDGTEEVEEGDIEQESQVDMEGDVGYLEGSYQEENNGLDNFDLAKMKSLKELESAILNKGDRVRAEKLLISLPTLISSQHPKIPRMIGEFTLSSSDISPEDLNLLQVPLSALSASWAARRLSIVGKHCRRTYCFTHSYGRLYDKSSGSLYWENACGPLSEDKYAVDREQLPSYLGTIRRFHPDELLAISGFPKGFIWSRKQKKLSLEKCSGCVGNSVNVTVVRCVMQVLFGLDTLDTKTQTKAETGMSSHDS